MNHKKLGSSAFPVDLNDVRFKSTGNDEEPKITIDLEEGIEKTISRMENHQFIGSRNRK